MRIGVSGKAPCRLDRVRRAVRAALRPYGLPADAGLTLAFVGDAAMRELNRRHRRKDRTTDVLSFGQDLGRASGARAVARLVREADGTLHLGDVVVSPAQARRQARRGGHALEAEVAFLAAHGALHLLGFDDATAAGRRRMIALGLEAVAGAGLRVSPPG